MVSLGRSSISQCPAPFSSITYPKDVLLSSFLRDNQARVEAIFNSALRRAQKEGELPAKEDTTALARFFVVTIQGMRAIARLHSDRNALEQVARIALAVFERQVGG
jgi:TetR/AcrR family transcriptional repressor of nem operon